MIQFITFLIVNVNSPQAVKSKMYRKIFTEHNRSVLCYSYSYSLVMYLQVSVAHTKNFLLLCAYVNNALSTRDKVIIV